MLSGINDLGQIVGYTGPSGSIGFLYDVASQTFTTINIPHVASTFAKAINNAGTIAGYVTLIPGSGIGHGFELVGSTYKKIMPPHSADSYVNGITTSGELAGFVTNVKHGGVNFLFVHGKYKSPIPGLGGGTIGVEGINPAGTALVGGYEPTSGVFAGFLYQNKIFQQLQFPGSSYTLAFGINSAGEVVGYFQDANFNVHGLTWTPPADAVKK